MKILSLPRNLWGPLPNFMLTGDLVFPGSFPEQSETLGGSGAVEVGQKVLMTKGGTTPEEKSSILITDPADD